MHDQHAVALVVEFLDGNAMAEALVQPCFGASGFGKCPGADNLSWSTIRDPEDDLAAAFVGDRNAVIDKLVEVKSAGCTLSFLPEYPFSPPRRSQA